MEGHRDHLWEMGEGWSAGCCCAARGKPISQIIGLDPTVLPRYPTFIRLPDWGRGAGRERRGSNYCCSGPAAEQPRRGAVAAARARPPGWGGRRGTVCVEARPAGGRLSRGRPRPRAPLPPRPAQLPHCLLWSQALPPPPPRPPSRSFLPSSRKKEEPVCGDE